MAMSANQSAARLETLRYRLKVARTELQRLMKDANQLRSNMRQIEDEIHRLEADRDPDDRNR